MLMNCVQELKEYKKEVEQRILEIIKEFEKTTKLHVKEVKTHSVRYMGGPWETEEVELVVEV